MSKIGKQPIKLPAGVSITVESGEARVKGPKGEVRKSIPADFKIEISDGEVRVIPPEKTKKTASALWGTTRAIIANMVKGVAEGFEKKLEFEGIGFRAEATSKELTLSVGFSHPVKLSIPDTLKVEVSKNVITISGADKELVGQFAAKVRSVKPPEPYKGTGIRYQGEVIRRKAGKKLAGTAA